jgi:hypothetical protein
MPTWEIDFSEEVRNYFIENGDFTGNLLGEIMRLIYTENGLPEGDYAPFDGEFILWLILGHEVYYRRQGNTILVAVVKPADDEI